MHSLNCDDVDDGLGKGLRGFLRQIVSDTVLDQPMLVLAGKFLGVSAGVRVWRALPLGAICGSLLRVARRGIDHAKQFRATMTSFQDALRTGSLEALRPKSDLLRWHTLERGALPLQQHAVIQFDLDSLQVLDQVAFLRRVEVQVEMPIVVIHHVEQGGEASIMVEAALLVRPQPCQRCRAVHVGRRAVGLERVDADLARRMQIVPRLGKERRDVAGRALGRALSKEAQREIFSE